MENIFNTIKENLSNTIFNVKNSIIGLGLIGSENEETLHCGEDEIIYREITNNFLNEVYNNVKKKLNSESIKIDDAEEQLEIQVLG